MTIYIRALVDGDIILQESDASSIKGYEDCALVHNDKIWIVYDIPTGLLIVYGHTKKEALENLYNKRIQMEQARKTQLYQKRIKEFEEMKKLCLKL